jgi:coenzyme F420-0:L-glutamate ligase/coenzyme F420-1:gamma-L-glutamate ligase
MDDEIRIIPLHGIPEIRPGDDLNAMIIEAIERRSFAPADGDVFVVAQKAVSKADGCLVQLSEIEPSPLAINYATRTEKDPRHVEVVLREAKRIVRMEGPVLIVETRHGFVCANAGVDRSNVLGEDTLALLPPDPDASARKIRDALQARYGVDVAVIISDTFGRPWREGQTNVAIGVAGIIPLNSYVGQIDTQGYELRVTAICVADQLAGAAEMAQGKTAQVPVAVVRGASYPRGEGSIAMVVRPPEKDLFR